MKPKFNYGDTVYYFNYADDEIKSAIFSEYWDYRISYINIAGESFTIETSNLFDSKKNLLLQMLKEKRNYIINIKNSIERVEKDILKLEKQLSKLEK